MARLIPPPRRMLTLEELKRRTDRLVAITDKESVVDDGSAAVGLYIFSRRAAAWKRIDRDVRTGGFQVKATAQIFLSYAREDEEKVENLYQKLSDAGFKPWMDKRDIHPGERWKSSIRKAVRRSDFFLACLSANSVNKRGFIQREIKDALDILQEMLDSDIYLIPVRLEDCTLPESLSEFQWVNLFEEDGWTRLVKAIQIGMERRAEEIKPNVQESTPGEDHDR
jgi:hypothetical protein